MDVSEYFFSCSGEGKGEPEAPGGGGVGFLLAETLGNEGLGAVEFGRNAQKCTFWKGKCYVS